MAGATLIPCSENISPVLFTPLFLPTYRVLQTDRLSPPLSLFLLPPAQIDNMSFFSFPATQAGVFFRTFVEYRQDLCQEIQISLNKIYGDFYYKKASHDLQGFSS